MSSFLVTNDKRNCVNCKACLQVCPSKCISFQRDFLDFEYPVIDKTKCIGCKKCESVCIFSNMVSPENEPIQYYAAWSQDDIIRQRSSSGGIFSELARNIIDRGGYVCGAVYDDSFHVKHVIVSNLDDLIPLCGSKYVQSDLENVFTGIRNLIRENKYVYFCGTPCQVASLKNFLKNENTDNLFTTDLICHGVLSQQALSTYIDRIEKKFRKKVINLNLRDKKSFGQGYYVRSIFRDNSDMTEKMNESFFYNLFSHNYYLRDSCFSCRYTNIHRVGDISLGDFWGIKKTRPELYDPKGISYLIVNTEKGLTWLKESAVELRESKYGEAIQDRLVCPSKPDIWHKYFIRNAKKNGLIYAMNQFTAKRPFYKKLIRYIQNKLVNI